MRLLTFLLVWCMLLAGGSNALAQSNHVYEDSSILYPQENAPVEEEVEVVAAPMQDDSYDEEASEAVIIDTQLTGNRLFLSADSVNAIRRERQFGYAKNLDSMLKAMQDKEQEIAKQEEAKKEQARKKSGNRNIDNTESSGVEKGSSMAERFFNSKKTQYFLWSLAGLFVLFVLYKLFFGGGAFQKSTTRSNVKVLDEEEAKPVKERKFDAAITKAASEKEYRQAVRYLYLQLLQRLSAAGAIEFAVDKTNTEYLRELTGKPYKDEVAELTRYYDYVWYGEFALDAAAYATIENRFRNITV